MRNGRKCFSLCLAVIFLFFTNTMAAPAKEQSPSYRTDSIAKEKLDTRSLTEKKSGLTKAQKKIGTELLQLIKDGMLPSGKSKAALVEEMQLQGQIAPGTVKSGGKAILEMKAYVYIQMKQDASLSAIDGYVSKIDHKNEKSKLAVAWVKLDALEKLASIEGVETVQTVLPPVHSAGSVTTEGDSVLQADLARVQGDTDGSGVKIGIISDGVDNYSSAVASGDLPDNVTVLSNTVGGDEGTAMLEIVHDLAPGAQLYFHDCGNNVLAFNQAIDALISAGCDVICDDISWIGEPFFEDGVIARHVDEILQDNEVVFVSSAGNSAMRHYQGQFHDDGYAWHDFSGGTSGYADLYVNIPSGGSVFVVLQWNEPFGGASSDYDLYLMYQDYSDYYETSQLTQAGTGDPLEYIYYENTSGSGIIAPISVHAYNALSPRTLEVYIYCYGGAYNYSNNIAAADSIFGHAAVPGVIACGAVSAAEPYEIEQFSSQGPVTMLSETREKPDVCGTDGVSVTGAGGFSNPFYGTSASAPHVAAIAALVKSKYPGLNASQVAQCIMNAAEDLGDSGFDYIFGHGRADALNSMGTVYTVAFDSQGGSMVQSVQVLENSRITEPSAPTRTGYSFAGWYKESGCVNPWNFSTERATDDTTLYAKWTAAQYTIAAAPNSTSYGSVTGGAKYNYGLTATVKATPKAGYRFVRWLEGTKQVSASALYSFIVTKNRTLKAEFAAIGKPALTAASAGYNSIRLTWTAVTGAAGYEVWRATSATGSYSKIKTVTGATAYTDTGRTTGRIYYYKVRAYCRAGTVTTYGSFSGYKYAKPVPAKPASVKAASASYNSIKTTWNAVSGATGYQVYRAASLSGKYVLAGTVSGTSFTNTGLTTGKMYYYKMRAYRLSGGTKVYGSFAAVTSAKPVPAKPASVKAASASYNSIKTTWNAVSGATGYQVYRATSLSGKYVLAGTVSGTSFTNTGLTTGKMYYYKVRAYRLSGGTKVYGSFAAVVYAKP